MTGGECARTQPHYCRPYPEPFFFRIYGSGHFRSCSFRLLRLLAQMRLIGRHRVVWGTTEPGFDVIGETCQGRDTGAGAPALPFASLVPVFRPPVFLFPGYRLVMSPPFSCERRGRHIYMHRPLGGWEFGVFNRAWRVPRRFGRRCDGNDTEGRYGRYYRSSASNSVIEAPGVLPQARHHRMNSTGSTRRSPTSHL